MVRSWGLPRQGLPGRAAEETGEWGARPRGMALARAGAFSLTRACILPAHASVSLHWRLYSRPRFSAAPWTAHAPLPSATRDCDPAPGSVGLGPWKASPAQSSVEGLRRNSSAIPGASFRSRSPGHLASPGGAYDGKAQALRPEPSRGSGVRPAPGSPTLARGASNSAATGTSAGARSAEQGAVREEAASDDALEEELPEVVLAAPPPGVEELEKMAEWVVFSDLHLRSQNCDVCMDVLRSVHQAAQERGAGILFLGDFWHVRASLPVRPLNAAVEEIASWTQPTLMLPGNHDQVTEDGKEHALLPLGAVNPRVHIISEPALFLGALWLPYRRDGRVIKAAVRKHAAHVHAIFAHIDVAGAVVNNTLQLQQGISPRIFPAGLPVFSGHYHKPHVVPGTGVEYVGSPYQTSLAEAGQAKRLLLLRAPGWQRAGEIPVHFGRRFHVLDGEARPWEALGAPQGEGAGVQAGDFVRWQIPEGLDEASVQDSLARLKEMDLRVDAVHPPRAVKPRMNLEPSKRLDPLSVLSAYQETVGLAQGVVEEAASILGSLEDAPPGLLHRPPMCLALDEVRLEGYGPFRSATVYPLRARGLRIVSGVNQDSAGSDSNGAGKTSLVMAPLWALAGCTDSRSPGSTYKGLTRDEVLNDGAPLARVAVSGSINGKPFSVERTAGRRSSLRFVLDGQDLTCQEIKHTQACIDEHIGTAFLPYTVFHGQHSTGNILLEASDAELKELLGKVTGMDVWVRAKEQSKKLAGERQRQCDAAQERSAEREQALKNLQGQMRRLQQDAAAWEAQRSRDVEDLEARAAAARAQLGGALRECAALSRRVEGALEAWSQHSAALEQEVKALAAHPRGAAAAGEKGAGAQDSAWQELEALAKARNELRERIAEGEGEMKARTSTLKEIQRRAERFEGATASGSAEPAKPVCDRCLQPLNTEHMERCRQQLRSEVENATRLHEESRKGVEEKRRELRDVEEQVHAVEQRRAGEEQARVDAVAATQSKLGEIQRCNGFAANLLRDTADLLSQSPLGMEIGAELQRAEEGDGAGEAGAGGRPREAGARGAPAEAGAGGRPREPRGTDWEALNELISGAMGALNAAKKAQNQASSLALDLERKRAEANPHTSQLSLLQQLVGEKRAETDSAIRELQEAMARLQVMKEVDRALGGAGIQSCLLETALDDLQTRVVAYLDPLSGGSLHLRLSATQEKKTKSAGRARVGQQLKEAIELVVSARSADGRLVRRSLNQLSGGERRRLGLALCLGFAEFAEHHTGHSSDLIVLDEVMQHLDEEGQSRVLSVLRNLKQSTVLLVSQANSAEAWDATAVDWVVKAEDCSTVQCASDAFLSTGALT